MAEKGLSRLEANQQIKPMNFKGREYAEVPQRLAAFWAMHPDDEPGTSITTEWLQIDPGFAICRAVVSVQGEVKATGTACEIKSNNGVNSTSHIENCETSAIGRALGIYGLGSGVSIASADEVKHAIEQQEAIAAVVQKPAKRPTKRATHDTPVPQQVSIEDARKTYYDALDEYCKRSGADYSETLAKHEAFFKAPAEQWTADMFLRIAAKFPKAVDNGKE